MKSTGSTKPDARATCESCSWTSDAKNALAGGSRHAEFHHHRVQVRVERIVYFDATTASAGGVKTGTLALGTEEAK